MFDQLTRALARRATLRNAGTDALRIVDGRGDDLPGIEIDDFAGHWLVQTREALIPDELRGDFTPFGQKSFYWKCLGENKAAPQHVAGERADIPFSVHENNVKFWIDFNAGYSQGIFLDQRENRARLRKLARGKTVLNCFAYSCAFGVAAALGGAKTVNVDLSKRYLDWGRRNYELNKIDIAEHDFLFGDVSDWLRRFARDKRLFDVVVLDPPTFSRDHKGRVFTVESGFSELVSGSVALLSPGGVLFCSTNQRGMARQDFEHLIREGLDSPRGWKFEWMPMPPDFTGDAYLKACWVSRRS